MELVHLLSTYNTQGMFILAVGLGAVIMSTLMFSFVSENWKHVVFFGLIVTALYISAIVKFVTEPRPHKFSDAYTIVKRNKTLELKGKDDYQQSVIVDLIDEDEKTYVVRYKGESYIIPRKRRQNETQF